MKLKKKKIIFIYNPKAGKSKIKEHLSDIIYTFNQAGFEITVYATQKSRDAVELVEKMDKGEFDYVICSGGDGTLGEVVTGMLKREEKVPIGYIPAGSTNDFAKSLKISSNILEAVKEITNEKIFQCDAGRFNNDAFVYIAAFGLFTEVSYNTDQQLKNILGHMAYILEGVKSLSSIKSYKMRIIAEEMTQEDDFIYGMITNSISVGGFKNITGKEVELDDGKFEVTLVRRPQNPVELNDIATSFVTRKFDSKSIVQFKTSALKIMSEDEVKWTLDGEYGGVHKLIEIKNEKKVISILCGGI